MFGQPNSSRAGQNATASRYCLRLFGIPCMTIVQRVMTAEGHVFANLAICATVFASAPAWQNFLVYRHGLGFVGAAWASSITNNQYLLLQIPYCLYVGLGHVFRPRSIREVFDRRGIREFLGLSLPGLVASTEWWSMEFVIALAGRGGRQPCRGRRLRTQHPDGARDVLARGHGGHASWTSALKSARDPKGAKRGASRRRAAFAPRRPPRADSWRRPLSRLYSMTPAAWS